MTLKYSLIAIFFSFLSCTENKKEESTSELIITRANDLLNETLAIDNIETSVRVWNLKKDNTIRINLVEIKGETSKHKHPDADHSIIIIEGIVKVLVGKKIDTLRKGDFISIPKNLPHKYWPLTKSVLFASMDAPYYDPEKTIRLE